jgi:integrase
MKWPASDAETSARVRIDWKAAAVSSFLESERRTHYPRKLPRVLTLDQVARLLEAAPGPGLKHKAALGIVCAPARSSC